MNESGSSTLTPVAFNYSSNTKKVYFEANLTYDMVAGQVLTGAYSCPSSKANPNGSLDNTLRAVPVAAPL